MTMAWRQLPVPEICERMIGFSLPREGEVLVVSYEGMHVVRLGPPVTVVTDSQYTEYDLYDPEESVCRYRNTEWTIIGLHAGTPIHNGRPGERLVLDPDAETISVEVAGQLVWSSTFENFSGDWSAATFSPEGRFIVLGCPYGFDFRVWERSR